MEKELRIKKLEEIRQEQKDKPYETAWIYYGGGNKRFDVYKIPIEYLIYNKRNGRIASHVKSFERQYKTLNAEDKKDSKIIEKFLWESHKERNKITMNDLMKKEQQKYGIVTNEGMIIDGNRRAMLLNKLWDNRESLRREGHNVDNCKFFIAVILPKGADEREISRLETTFQMGEDEKLRYDAIEKYLKCKDLGRYGFSEVDIAEMMGEEKKQIEEWLEIMKLMDEYLSVLDYNGIYRRLEKREDQFITLNRALKSYERGNRHVNWEYDTRMDVSDLKSVCFDYIRAQYEGKDFRIIGGAPSKEDSIFCNGKVWEDFLKFNKEHVESINKEEKSVNEWKKESPDADLPDLFKARDTEWREKIKGLLQGNINKGRIALDNIKESNMPVKLIGRALDTLNAVNTGNAAFYDEKVNELLKGINSLTWQYMQSIKYGLKKMKKKKK